MPRQGLVAVVALLVLTACTTTPMKPTGPGPVGPGPVVTTPGPVSYTHLTLPTIYSV